MQALEQVHLNDITGPLADKALFLAGGVKFYREDYHEADHYFSKLVEQHQNSPLAPQAIELAIISKHMSTGGPDYDGRKVAEARLLVDSALRNYPELARDKSGFLERQLGSITYQQAEKDYMTAEFYRRTGHPGSAYFYYEIVRRRYPGIEVRRPGDGADEPDSSAGRGVGRQAAEHLRPGEGEHRPDVRARSRPTADGRAGGRRRGAAAAGRPDPAAMPRSLPTNLGPRN